MLGIGVGAGRTSLYFGDKDREYVGIDYSSSMVEGKDRTVAYDKNKNYIMSEIIRRFIKSKSFMNERYSNK